MATRMLITGAGGMLGHDLLLAASTSGLDATGMAREQLDITDARAVAELVRETAPAVVVNCAAWTDVDGAEASPQAAAAVNGGGAGNVARAAHAAGAWTIHVSSDYVFNGAKHDPYLESDPTDPLSAYGRSKLAGEHEVARAAPAAHTIVRSSWLFGRHGRCFPATIIGLARERDHLNVVDDQVGSPTFTAHLADALVELARRPARPLGVLHRAAGDSCSWFEFATEVVAQAELDCEVRPVPTSQMPRPAVRPAYSVLGSERRSEAPLLPEWRRGLAEYMSSPVVSR